MGLAAMTHFNASALKIWLFERDVRVRPPATPAALRQLQASFDRPIHSDILALYETFDGCADDDFEVESFFTFWPIDRGLEYMRERALNGMLPFGDVSLSADVVLCAATEPTAPVRWHDEILPRHDGFDRFIDTLMRGKLWS